MKAATQAIRPDLQWLYGRGWTLREAADCLKVNHSHLSRVLSGERLSKRLIDRVSKLPYKKLTVRRKVSK